MNNTFTIEILMLFIINIWLLYSLRRKLKKGEWFILIGTLAITIVTLLNIFHLPY